jgi:hypothetical protein
VRHKRKRRALPKTQKGNNMKTYTFDHLTIQITDDEDEMLRYEQKEYRKWCIENGFELGLNAISYINYLETKIKIAFENEVASIKENKEGE